jgi:deoxyguanosine kinase
MSAMTTEDFALSEQPTKRPWYIVVEGAIGVGKTTLARMLRDHFQSGLQLEVFEENPFLADFYADRARYAFQTQIFFLLSRYRQQQQVPRRLAHGSLISDYMFAKDWLFAHLNLEGDEWEIYQQLHTALAEQIRAPDLIIYLQADTDVLLGRIAQRDRTYERDMDRDYIQALRQIYEQFFQEHRQPPILYVDTNHLNYVTRPDDFQSILNRINSFLQEGSFQQPLPQFEPVQSIEQAPSWGHQIADFQRFHIALDKAKGFNTDVFFNYICLSEEMGELGRELARIWRQQEAYIARGQPAEKAFTQALAEQRVGIESELADCMAYLLKLANYVGIDLEQAYLAKMRINQARSWPE